MSIPPSSSSSPSMSSRRRATEWEAELRYAPRIQCWRPDSREEDGIRAALRSLGVASPAVQPTIARAGGMAISLEQTTAEDRAAIRLAASGADAMVVEGADEADAHRVMLLGTPAILSACAEVLAATEESAAAIGGLLQTTRERYGRRLFSISLPGRSTPLDLETGRPVIMGVLNVTPDSFSDGGRYTAVDAAVSQAERMLADGAAIIDVGGESTRPGADPVPAEEEAARVVPVIERISAMTDRPVSIDTMKPAVARRALDAGARLINDVSGFRDAAMIALAAEYRVPVCVMHMQGEPRTMQQRPEYRDVVADVAAFLRSRTQDLMAAGVPRDHIIVDPGFGFGKTVAHNVTLLRRMREFASLGQPILAGLSRKSSLAKLSDGAPPEDRLPESLAAHILAAEQGAHILRVHDVREMRKALAIGTAAPEGD